MTPRGGLASPSAALKHSPESSISERAALQDAKLCTAKVPGHPRPCTAVRSFAKKPKRPHPSAPEDTTTPPAAPPLGEGAGGPSGRGPEASGQSSLQA